MKISQVVLREITGVITGREMVSTSNIQPFPGRQLRLAPGYGVVVSVEGQEDQLIPFENIRHVRGDFRLLGKKRGNGQ